MSAKLSLFCLAAIALDVIFVWKFLIKDNLVFIMHSGACFLCVYKSIKKERSASQSLIKYMAKQEERFYETKII